MTRTVDVDSIQVLPYDVHGNGLGKWHVHWTTHRDGETRAHDRGPWTTKWGAEREAKKMRKALS